MHPRKLLATTLALLLTLTGCSIVDSFTGSVDGVSDVTLTETLPTDPAEIQQAYTTLLEESEYTNFLWLEISPTYFRAHLMPDAPSTAADYVSADWGQQIITVDAEMGTASPTLPASEVNVGELYDQARAAMPDCAAGPTLTISVAPTGRPLANAVCDTDEPAGFSWYDGEVIDRLPALNTTDGVIAALDLLDRFGLTSLDEMILEVDGGFHAYGAQQSVTNQDGSTCTWRISFSKRLLADCMDVEPSNPFEVSEIDRSAVGPAIEDLWATGMQLGGGIAYNQITFDWVGPPANDNGIYVVLANQPDTLLRIKLDGTGFPE